MSDVPVIKGSIAKGFASIADYLGFDASKTVFTNSLINDPDHPFDSKMNDTDGLDWRSAQYVTLLSAKGTRVATFDISPVHTEYLKKYVAEGDLQMLPASGRAYPGGSVVAQLRQKTDTLAGMHVWNSYQTQEVVALNNQLGNKPLVPAETYFHFLSKAYIRNLAHTTALSVAPGLVFDKPAPIREYVAHIMKMAEVTPLKKIWVKAASLSGGQGIVPVENPDENSIKAAFNTVGRAYKDAGFFNANAALQEDDPFQGIKYFMPVVVEADIGTLPGVKDIAANAGVQAVVSKDKVTLVGTTLQQTKNGEYMGSVLPKPEDEAAVKVAEAEAAKLLVEMSKRGYVGFAGVDVIVARGENGELKPHVLEVNPRLTGATPLLAMVQKLEETSGQKVHAVNVVHSVPGGAEAVYSTIGKQNLYRAKESGYEGILPYMLDTNDAGKTTFRVLIVAKSEERMERLCNALKTRVQQRNLRRGKGLAC